MTKDEYFEQLDRMQREYDVAWSSYMGHSSPEAHNSVTGGNAYDVVLD